MLLLLPSLLLLVVMCLLEGKQALNQIFPCFTMYPAAPVG